MDYLESAQVQRPACFPRDRHWDIGSYYLIQKFAMLISALESYLVSNFIAEPIETLLKL